MISNIIVMPSFLKVYLDKYSEENGSDSLLSILLAAV